MCMWAGQVRGSEVLPRADSVLAGRDVLPQRERPHRAQLIRLTKTPPQDRYQISGVACFRLIAPAVRTTAPGPGAARSRTKGRTRTSKWADDATLVYV